MGYENAQYLPRWSNIHRERLSWGILLAILVSTKTLCIQIVVSIYSSLEGSLFRLQKMSISYRNAQHFPGLRGIQGERLF